MLLLEPDEYKAAYRRGYTELAEKYKNFHKEALSNPSDAVFFFTANRFYANIRATEASLTNSSERLDLTNSTATNNENIRSGEWSNLQILGEQRVLDAIRYSKALANTFPFAVKGSACREILSACSKAHDQLENSLLIQTKYRHPNLYKTLVKEFALGSYRYSKSENIIEDIKDSDLHLPKRSDLLYLRSYKPTTDIFL